MKSLLSTFPILLVVCCLFPRFATADLAIDGVINQRPFNFVGSNTVGYRFRVVADSIRVTELGMWDEENTAGAGDGDGFLNTVQVGLWSDNQDMLAMVSFDPGTSGTLMGGFRYQPLAAPVFLIANQEYVLGARRQGDTNNGDRYQASSFTEGTDFTTSTNIDVLESRSIVGMSLSFPTDNPDSPGSNGNEALVGPNMVFVMAPEPALLPLFSLATGLFVGRRRRRVAAQI